MRKNIYILQRPSLSVALVPAVWSLTPTSCPSTPCRWQCLDPLVTFWISFLNINEGKTADSKILPTIHQPRVSHFDALPKVERDGPHINLHLTTSKGEFVVPLIGDNGIWRKLDHFNGYDREPGVEFSTTKLRASLVYSNRTMK